jgi:hypothetical protein
MFKLLDGMLLGPAQWLCDRIQRLTGLTKFVPQKWMMILMPIFFWGGFIFLELDSLIVGYMLLFTVSAAFFVRQAEREEAEFLANGNLRSSPANILFVRLFMALIFGFFGGTSLFLQNVGGQLFFYGSTCSIAWVYFSACIPRPPGKSKIREWYEKGLQWLNDKLEPTPVPTSDQ